MDDVGEHHCSAGDGMYLESASGGEVAGKGGTTIVRVSLADGDETGPPLFLRSVGTAHKHVGSTDGLACGRFCEAERIGYE